MRVLLLLRGSAGCGKSTFIEQNGLKNYTLSADNLRLLYQSPITNVDGRQEIDCKSDNTVWSMLFKILEYRMSNGEFTVIDATNSKTCEMTRYKVLAQTYRYRMYCVDFTNIPISEVKRRNKQRVEYKIVPDEAIDKMYSRFESQKIPSGITVIKPNELDKIWYKPTDLSNYNKIHHIGDVHGCYSILQKYLKSNGGLKDDEFYIFTGDYIDRGIENAKTVEFIMSIINKPNVIMLEGNHEKWLKLWAKDKEIQSKEFNIYTKIALEKNNISKKDVRQFYRKLSQCAYYIYKDKKYFVTHGGLSTLPNNLTLISTQELIKGTGQYKDSFEVDNNFNKLMGKDVIQIHGHRNLRNTEVRVNPTCYNLEGQVEFGGCLRCLQVSDRGCVCIELKNDVCNKKRFNQSLYTAVSNQSNLDLLNQLRNNKYIVEKQYDKISSFNFNRKVFKNKIWNDQTIKARGLYLDNTTGDVVARSYDKFFNINEMPETDFSNLQRQLKFPLTCYVKENGFLGIVSYDKYNDDLFITTKSNPYGLYADFFKKMLFEKIHPNNIKLMKQIVKKENTSLVFECVDMTNDPHIIEYANSKLILLDAIKNDINFSKYSYNQLQYLADNLNVICKTKAFTINNWQEFFDWYNMVNKENYEYYNHKIEGFVIEDNNGYNVKLKLAYYSFWKQMRGVAHTTLKYGYIRHTSMLRTPLSNAFYSYMRELFTKDDKDNLPMDICSLRKMFYRDTEYKK